MQIKAQGKQWFAAVLCVLIALLALHVKLSQYDSRPDPNSIISLKMWVDGQKAQLHAAPSFAANVWFLALFLFSSLFIPYPFITLNAPVASSARQRAFLFDLFLRPPPVLRR
ncbi:MAG TPA: hypothetical protein VKZ53_30750 [Candidatus Angelobacter sp.]|nr:hypothetical protein [Candidatus Angelobacter sp.]